MNTEEALLCWAYIVSCIMLPVYCLLYHSGDYQLGRSIAAPLLVERLATMRYCLVSFWGSLFIYVLASLCLEYMILSQP